MSKLDEFPELLKDGTWHNLTSIAETLKLTLDTLEKTAETLAKQDLIRHNPEAKKVKISPEWIALLAEEENACMLHSYLGIGRHKLQNFITDVFIDISCLE